MYTVRYIRANLKEILDKVDNGVHIEFKRGDRVYTIKSNNVVTKLDCVGSSSAKISFPNFPNQRLETYGCGCKRTEAIICPKHQRV